MTHGAPSGTGLIMLIGFHHVFLWLGMALFGLNFAADKLANLPIAEIGLTGLMAFLLAQQPKDIFRGQVLSAAGLGAWLLIFLAPLLGLVVLGDIAKGYGLQDTFRDGLKMALMVLPFLFYMALGHRAQVLQLLVGFVLGYGLFVLGYVGLELAQGGISREVRNMMPSPALLLLLGLFGGRILSHPLRMLCLGLGLVLTGIAMAIEVRGAMLGLVLASGVGFGAWLMRLTHFPARRLILTAVFLAVPFVPWWLVVQFDGFVWLEQYYATYSNLERAALIQFSHDETLLSPWIGYDMQLFRSYFINMFEGLSGWNVNNKAPDSPHSFYVDMAVMFGLPVLLLCLAFWGVLYRHVLGRAQQGLAAAAFGLAIITVHLAFFGYTDVRRLEILAIVAFLLYRHITPTNPSSSPESALPKTA